MKKKILVFFIAILSFFSFAENIFAAEKDIEWCIGTEKDPFCTRAIKSDLKPSWDLDLSFDELVLNIVTYLLGFLGFLSTIYWLYWAWNIFSALDNDDKVKKWRTIILRACLWLVVIFAAYPIARFVIEDILFNDWTDKEIETID